MKLRDDTRTIRNRTEKTKKKKQRVKLMLFFKREQCVILYERMASEA